MYESLAPRTITAYTKAWTNFSNFCISHGVRSLPAPPIIIAHYISDCYLKGLAYTTVLSRVSVIAYAHKIKLSQDPTTDNVVRNVLKGLNKCTASADTRSPITRIMLHELCDSLRYVISDGYHQILCKAMFLLLWHLALRVSEICGNDRQCSHALRLGDVEFVRQAKTIAARFHFKKYKHSHSPSILLVQSDSTPFCPVAALQSYLTVRTTPSTYLFVHPSGSAVSAAYLRRILLVSKSFNSWSNNVALHSFRIGKITSLVTSGASENAIRLLGRFKSDAYKSYIRVSNVK